MINMMAMKKKKRRHVRKGSSKRRTSGRKSYGSYARSNYRKPIARPKSYKRPIAVTKANTIDPYTMRAQSAFKMNTSNLAVSMYMGSLETYTFIPIYTADVPTVINGVTVQGWATAQFLSLPVSVPLAVENNTSVDRNAVFRKRYRNGDVPNTQDNADEMLDDKGKEEIVEELEIESAPPVATDQPGVLGYYYNPAPITYAIILLKNGVDSQTMINNLNQPTTTDELIQAFTFGGIALLNDSSKVYVPENDLLYTTIIVPFASTGTFAPSCIPMGKSMRKFQMAPGDQIFVAAKRGKIGLPVEISTNASINYAFSNC